MKPNQHKRPTALSDAEERRRLRGGPKPKPPKKPTKLKGVCPACGMCGK